MMKTSKILAILLCLVLTQAASAQIIATLQPCPQVNKLPVLSVHRIMQDSQGYIWYGTVNGLCRDDGYDIRVVRNDFRQPQIPMQSNIVLSLCEDSLHHIIFGTPSGAFCLDPSNGSVKSFFPEVLSNERIHEIYCAADGSIHLSTAYATYVDSGDGVLRKTADEASARFYQISDGTLISGFYGKGLCRYHPLSCQWTPLDSLAAHLPVSAMTEAGGYLWLATSDRGFVRADMTKQPTERYIVQPETKNVIGQPVRHFFHVVAEQDGRRLWATSYDDFHAFDIDSTSTLQPIDLSLHLRGFSNDLKMMSEMIRTRDGNIWIAGYDRASVVVDFEHFNRERYDVPPIQERFDRSTLIISLQRDEGTRYWLSQERVGLCLYDTNTHQLTTVADCPSTAGCFLYHIHMIAPSRRPHSIWTVTATDHVYGIESSGMQMRLIHDVQLPRGELFSSLFEDQDGTLWIGGHHGIYRYMPSDRRLLEVAPQCGHATGFTQTQDGTVYATITGKGIYECMDTTVQCRVSIDADLLSVASTTDGTLWVGTGDGRLIAVERDGSLSDHSELSGMNGDMVESIVADTHNHLWILSNSHLIEYAPLMHVFRVVKTRQPSSLPRFMPHGLALCQDNGDVLVSGLGGFLVCHSSLQLEGIARPVRAQVTDIHTSLGSFFPLQQSLPASARNIEIHFSTFDHLHASTQRYAYRLDGGDWEVLRMGVNTIHLARISAGKHTLNLRATDADGLWSSQITTFQFTRKPHWWESTQAYILYIICAVALAVLAVRYLMRRSRREEEAIWSDSAELVAMRDYVMAASDTLSTSSTTTSSEYAAIDQMLLDRARKSVEQHLCESDFGVNDLAADMNMSRSTLVRKLKAITGQTPLQFIREVKMSIARQMLQQHSTSVSDVAHRLGYSDREHFTNVFREVTGMLPSEVRKDLSS